MKQVCVVGLVVVFLCTSGAMEDVTGDEEMLDVNVLEAPSPTPSGQRGPAHVFIVPALPSMYAAENAPLTGFGKLGKCLPEVAGKQRRFKSRDAVRSFGAPGAPAKASTDIGLTRWNLFLCQGFN